MARFNLIVPTFKVGVQTVVRILRLTARDKTHFDKAQTSYVIFLRYSVAEFSETVSTGKFCPKPRLQLRIARKEYIYMNKEQYKQKFGKAERKESKKNKTCWHKDCGYCLKYRTKCFNCHTND